MSKSKSNSQKTKKHAKVKAGIFSRVNNRLLFTIVVAVGIIGTYLIFQAAAAPKTQPAVTLSLSPTSQRLAIGDTLSVALRLNTNGQNVNAVQASVTYPAGQLEYVAVDSTGSAFTIDVPVSAAAGTLSIPRANITPVNSGDALLTTIQFKAIVTGRKVQVKVGTNSQVLSSDTNANILQKVINGQYSIQ